MNARLVTLAPRAAAPAAGALLATLALLASGTAHASPATFPNAGWVTVLNNGTPLTDTEGDVPGPRDIVGDAANPAFFINSDATHLFFRLRIDEDPRKSNDQVDFEPFGWGCFINTDSNVQTYEFSTLVDGNANPDQISFFKNTETTTPDSPSDPPDDPPVSFVQSPLTASVLHARVLVAGSTFGGTPDFFLDWAVEKTSALAAGYDPTKGAGYYCGSANNGSVIESDCTGGTSDCSLSGQFSDPVTCTGTACGSCGDAAINGAESCDDGNLTNGDGCNAVCLRELGQACATSPQCASAFCDPANNTCACDQASDCPAGQLCNTNPNPNTCVAPGCGNQVLEPGEGCDDGNLANGDGCNAGCLRELGQACAASAQCASAFCDSANNTCACDQASDCPAGLVCNTAPSPNTCVAAGCGNQVLEPGEGCDDGNLANGDGCNAGCLRELGQTCATSPQCASAFCDPASNTCACDQNADCASGQVCNTVPSPNACVNAGCGNQVLEASEGCDDGNLTSGDGCNAGCLRELGQTCATSPQCASGFCDAFVCACDQDADCGAGQVCNTAANPNACTTAGCGNQVLEAGEACDDGNLTSGDGCDASCLRELGEPCATGAQCASAFCDSANNTCACDQASDCPAGQLCDTASSPNACVAPGCGNGVIEPATEACDDGALAAGDGCGASCLLEIGETCNGSNTACESGLCDAANDTCACDADADCPAGALCNLLAAPNACVAPGCGNGVLEAGEGCDDDAQVPGDGCDASCLLELGQTCATSGQCASAFCDPANNTCACNDDADCPAGALCDTVSAPNACVAPGCGNRVLEAGEGCDDGAQVSGDGCDAECLLELGQTCATSGQCASDFCDPAVGACACNEDGDCAIGQVCKTDVDPNVCTQAGCGNGVPEVGEACDDGGFVNGDGCDAACLLEIGVSCPDDASCASGFCDPTNDTCACDQDVDCPTGQLCNTVEGPNACVAPGCGNGVPEPATEGCDDGNQLAGDGCSAACLRELGQPCVDNTTCESTLCDGTTNACACDEDADCPAGSVCDAASNPNACVPAGCGNGVRELGEACDDGGLVDGDGCDAQCLKELGEPCALSGECASGFCDPAGNVCACDEDADCGAGPVCDKNAAPNACVAPGCGNGVLEASEACDDGGLAPGDGCGATCLREIDELCDFDAQCETSFCDDADGTCACDQNADCPAGSQCNTTLAPNECVPAGCGNSVVSASEGCDDGNLDEGDGCDAQCLLELGEDCVDSDECASAFCDPANDTCACDQNSDCPGAQVCDASPDPNACVGSVCGDGSVDGTETCDDGGKTDGDGCSSACKTEPGFECTGEPSSCVPGACTSDADCVFCNEQYGICVQACSALSPCGAGFFCDAKSSICVPKCQIDAECPSGACDEATGNCVECEADAQCPTGVACQDGTCGNPCGAQGACEGGLVCDPVANQCVRCSTDAQCGAGLACIDRRCAPLCNQEADCAGVACNETIGACVECTTSADCPAGQACDVIVGRCGCTVDADCAAGETCDASSKLCVPTPTGCATDADCPSGQICDVANAVCVECLTDADCKAGEICDPANVCVLGPVEGCKTNADCPSGQICDVPNAVCVDCLTDTDCQAGKVCSDANTCVDGPETGCATDADCPSGQVCDVANAVCVDCLTDADCDAGQVCNDANACVAIPPTGCKTDADCTGGLVCDEPAETCVDCVVDADCAANETCEPASHTCKDPGFVDPNAGYDFAGGGCSCSVPGSEPIAPSRWAGLGLGALALAAALRRRQRRVAPRAG